MIRILFTLHSNDGDTDSHEISSATHVPRIGELVSVEPYRCYQVLDVLWHLDDDPCVSITACELDWHKHMAKTRAAWDYANRP
ncbi:hypothetical protein GCM10011609_86210 [Lentzea pudingi]|uniref:Uncharacterized protein n=1 Tax=Lentzea pudingi TaxID=1789439 RepID=A0ABQ2IWI3_9PSEU|nr:hypothetical protein [Lentzea pudingi]GGN29293.1 hypothetical protein GCM10011609_86210 [Lentzea pudingi]